MVRTRSQNGASGAQKRAPPAKRKAPDCGVRDDVVAPVVEPNAADPAVVGPAEPIIAEPPRARVKVSPPPTPPLIPENAEEGERFHQDHRQLSDWVVITIVMVTTVACILLNTTARAIAWNDWAVPFANLVWTCAVDVARVFAFIACEILQLVCFETPWPDEFKNPQQ